MRSNRERQLSQILLSLDIDHGYLLFDVMDASESILGMSLVLLICQENKIFYDKHRRLFL
ncbi:hypothetical protein DOS84_11600 [Flavobacterium aquariorum]|uniref:Uncharacterized protein n=1 Tax=Flavobacterium aquariorum TaxID=2217670 RepID=A0A2W7UCW4_9FLAO|nr:hypothetical protein DOS84_11600 [Flavobacterium aquariorum]